MTRPHKQMGERIRKARRLKDLTQQQLAEALNVSVQSVSQWETGRTKPDSDRLSRLSDLIGTAAIYLTEGGLTNDGKIPTTIKQADRAGIHSRHAPLIKNKADALGYIASLIGDDDEELILAQYKPIGRLFSYVLTERDEAAPEYREGDLFIVDDGIGFRNGDIVLALDFGADTLEFRQVRGVRLDNRDRTIVDLRPLDRDETAPPLDLDEDENRILGTVVEHRRVRSR